MTTTVIISAFAIIFIVDTSICLTTKYYNGQDRPVTTLLWNSLRITDHSIYNIYNVTRFKLFSNIISRFSYTPCNSRLDCITNDYSLLSNILSSVEVTHSNCIVRHALSTHRYVISYNREGAPKCYTRLFDVTL